MSIKQLDRGSKFPALDDMHGDTTADIGHQDVERTPVFYQYLMIALRWKVLVGAILAGFLIGGLIITFLMTPKYTAVTTIEIAREGNRITPVQGVEREASDADLEFYQTQYGLLRSNSLAERVVRELRLGDDRAFFDLFGKRPVGTENEASSDGPLPTVSRDDRVRQAATILLDNIQVSPVRLSRLVVLSFTAPDKVLSARVANAWASNFIASTLERRYDATSYARKFLENRLGQLRVRLEESERQLVGYASREKIINIPSAVQGGAERSIEADNLAAFNQALNLATADRLKAAARVGSGTTADGASIEALQNSAISGLRQKRAELAAQYQDLMVKFEPGYPQAKAVKAQIDQLDRSVAREEGRVTSTLRGQYSESLQREQELSTRVNRLQGSLLEQRRRSIQYQIFQREADTNRQLYDALLQRYKEIGVASGVGVNNISVVDSADTPKRPSSPRLIFNILLSLIAGVMASAAAIFVLEQSGDSFDDPDKIERDLNIPLLGTVPMVLNTDPVLALADPKSQILEAYLSVEASLSLATEQGVPQVFSITSTRPAEGKSLSSLALATLLARSGRATILVDGDMRSPSVATMLELQNDHGLSNFLSGQASLDKLIVSAPGLPLKVLVAGPPPPNAAELLSGTRMQGLIDQLRAQFDHVVIDSPPVMGLADAPLIGSRVDAVVLAVESHGIRANMVRRAFKRLIASRVRVVGAILTKFRKERAHLGYGYDYGYGYGQQDDVRRN